MNAYLLGRGKVAFERDVALVHRQAGAHGFK